MPCVGGRTAVAMVTGTSSAAAARRAAEVTGPCAEWAQWPTREFVAFGQFPPCLLPASDIASAAKAIESAFPPPEVVTWVGRQ